MQINNQIKLLDNKYQITKTLGTGEYSKVKLCRSLIDDQTYAVKIFKKGTDKNPLVLDLLRNEVEVLSKLQCENIVKLIDYSDAKGSIQDEFEMDLRTNVPFIVTKNCEKGELFDLVRSKKGFPIKIVRNLFAQIMNGIQCLQKNNIAHRDLKLENLVLDEKYQLKIIDFGFACQVRNSNNYPMKYDNRWGTEGYMAPEVIKGKYTAEKIDVFSAGVVLFCMLFGHAPFFKATQHDKFYSLFIEKDNRLYWERILKGKPISIDTLELLNKMLAYHPGDRISADEIMESEFMRGETATSDELIQFFSCN